MNICMVEISIKGICMMGMCMEGNCMTQIHILAYYHCFFCLHGMEEDMSGFVGYILDHSAEA